MSAAAEPAPAPGDTRALGRALHLGVPAAISVVAFLVIDLVLAGLVGRPWGPAYPVTMDALVLLRMGPLFFSGLIVWPAMRARVRGCPPKRAPALRPRSRVLPAQVGQALA